MSFKGRDRIDPKTPNLFVIGSIYDYVVPVSFQSVVRGI